MFIYFKWKTGLIIVYLLLACACALGPLLGFNADLGDTISSTKRHYETFNQESKRNMANIYDMSTGIVLVGQTVNIPNKHICKPQVRKHFYHKAAFPMD